MPRLFRTVLRRQERYDLGVRLVFPRPVGADPIPVVRDPEPAVLTGQPERRPIDAGRQGGTRTRGASDGGLTHYGPLWERMTPVIRCLYGGRNFAPEPLGCKPETFVAMYGNRRSVRRTEITNRTDSRNRIVHPSRNLRIP